MLKLMVIILVVPMVLTGLVTCGIKYLVRKHKENRRNRQIVYSLKNIQSDQMERLITIRANINQLQNEQNKIFEELNIRGY